MGHIYRSVNLAHFLKPNQIFFLVEDFGGSKKIINDFGYGVFLLPKNLDESSGMLHVFRLLAPLRILRGTPFDVLGLLAERRMERSLIVEFEQLIDELLPALREDRLGEAREIVALYMNIRGYGPVKAEAADLVRGQVAARMQNLLSVSAEAA